MSSERDLFSGFERMRREIDELFGDVVERSGLRGRGFVPAVDVLYLDDPPRAVVRADLAGVSPERLGLEIRGRKLVIAGERRTVEPGARLYQQLEIEQGVFRRVVELGADVIAEEARAAYDDGILRVEVPLARREQPVRQVPIEEGGTGMSIHIPSGDGEFQEVPVGSGLPDELPVLPLRESVPFPNMLIPLAVGQERSIQLVNDVWATTA